MCHVDSDWSLKTTFWPPDISRQYFHCLGSRLGLEDYCPSLGLGFDSQCADLRMAQLMPLPLTICMEELVMQHHPAGKN